MSSDESFDAIPLHGVMLVVPEDQHDQIEIRSLASEADYEACVDLQRAIWGHDIREVVPPAILQVSQKVGGIAAGAFESNGRLVGFVFGLTGIVGGEPTHWSHLLAVHPGERDRGVGYRLKLHQRDQLSQMGVNVMFWTFDPLEARNAYLNLNRLGAQVEEYVLHMYGEVPAAATDAIIGTDRLVVCWRRDEDEKSRAAVDWTEAPTVTTIGRESGQQGDPALVAAPVVRVEIPSGIQELKVSDPEAALHWRLTSRRAFQHYLGHGYRVEGFARGSARHRPFYVLAAPSMH
jgi:predicted GNAT superfamily acetyltransferase